VKNSKRGDSKNFKLGKGKNKPQNRRIFKEGNSSVSLSYRASKNSRNSKFRVSNRGSSRRSSRNNVNSYVEDIFRIPKSSSKSVISRKVAKNVDLKFETLSSSNDSLTIEEHFSHQVGKKSKKSKNFESKKVTTAAETKKIQLMSNLFIQELEKRKQELDLLISLSKQNPEQFEEMVQNNKEIVDKFEQ
jgi:hypothetical protein